MSQRKPFLPSTLKATHRVGDRVCTEPGHPSKRWIAGSAYHTPASYKSPPVDVVEERRASRRSEPWANPHLEMGTVLHTSIDRRNLVVKLDRDGTMQKFDSKQVVQPNGVRAMTNQQMKSLSETISKEERILQQQEQQLSMLKQQQEQQEKEAEEGRERERVRNISQELAETIKYGNTLPLPGMFTRPPTTRQYTRPCMANLYTHHVTSSPYPATPSTQQTSSSSNCVELSSSKDSAVESIAKPTFAESNRRGSTEVLASPPTDIATSQSRKPPASSSVTKFNESDLALSTTVKNSVKFEEETQATSHNIVVPKLATESVPQEILEETNENDQGEEEQGTVLLVKSADGSTQKIVIPFQVTELEVCGPDVPSSSLHIAQATEKPVVSENSKVEQALVMRKSRRTPRPSSARILKSLPTRNYVDALNVPTANLPTIQIARPGSAIRPNSAVPRTSRPTPHEALEKQKYLEALNNAPCATSALPITSNARKVLRPQTSRIKINPSPFASTSVPLEQWEAENPDSARFMSFGGFASPNTRPVKRAATASTTQRREYDSTHLQHMVTTTHLGMSHSGGIAYQ